MSIFRFHLIGPRKFHVIFSRSYQMECILVLSIADIDRGSFLYREDYSTPRHSQKAARYWIDYIVSDYIVSDYSHF